MLWNYRMLLQKYFASVLQDLVQHRPAETLADAAQLLSSTLQARVDFLDLDAGTPLAEALRQRFAIEVQLEYAPAAEPTQPALAVGEHAAEAEPPAVPALVHAPSPRRTDLASDPRFTRFIRDLDKLESRRDFIWVGYLVKERL